jgi:hypothetical protein
VQITVKADFSKINALLDGTIKQVPFATARALTATAKAVQKELEQEIDRVFDAPVAFTRRGVGITFATKLNLRAEVFLKRRQAAYLDAQIKGGPRKRKPFEARFNREQGQPVPSAVPGSGAKLNQFGNLSRGQIAQLARQARGGKQNVFVPKPGGRLSPGVYQRQPDGRVKAVLVFTKAPAKYRKLFDFYRVARKTVAATWSRNFATSMRNAIRTAS